MVQYRLAGALICRFSYDPESAEKFEDRCLRLEDEDGANGIDYDCTFIVGDEKIVFKGHKLLFSAASKVFKATFYGNLKAAEVAVDLHPEAFQGLKQFIYTGRIDFKSAMHALLVYKAARKFSVPALGKQCISYIEGNKIHPAEVLKFYEHCRLFEFSEFEQLCCNTIQNETYEVVESEYFNSAKPESIEVFMKLESLRFKSEIQVFENFERWAIAEAVRKEIRTEDMSSHFNSLIKHIKFLTISFEEFVSKVSDSPLLSDKEKLAVACNLMKSDSKPMPENLSSEKAHRKFIIGTDTGFRRYVVGIHKPTKINKCYQYSTFFKLLIEGATESNESIQEVFTRPKRINHPKASFCISYTDEVNGYICFKAELENLSLTDTHRQNGLIITLESKFQAPTEESCGDLIVESIVDINPQRNEEACLIAKIPKELIMKIRRCRFDSDVFKGLIIKGSFNLFFSS
ncbi:hypothetical protein LSTR_LSTR003656 [Laodelphax striatellus]|uniref:BTB domain-containing protein n=1 Tax=Laodelphax striatellus TaxID=195883 RepID=A0A482XAZ7_LAOST|nr:hypothetical protein LSTR_LSTR003656 [Laodelphax striatellus]